MEILTEKYIDEVVIPANFKINELMNKAKNRCDSLDSCDCTFSNFAFGQSPFPAYEGIVKALQENADKISYLPALGIPELREKVSEWYNHFFQLETTAGDIFMGPGSKVLVVHSLKILEGDLIVPTPSWVSYVPQALLLKKQVHCVPLEKENGYKLTPEQLAKKAAQMGEKQKILILNSPHNPTGAIYSERELIELAKVCEKYNIFVISDEIYAQTTFNQDDFTSMRKVYKNTIVTTGMSKDRSCGGYRVGVGILPGGEANERLRKNLLKVISSTYSCLAAPMQHMGLTGFDINNKGLLDYIDTCRQIHKMAGNYSYNRYKSMPGVTVTKPLGGFYVYLDFNCLKEQFQKHGLDDVEKLALALRKHPYHAAMLPGTAMMKEVDNLVFRASFVDYDGKNVLKKFAEEKPTSKNEEEEFIKKYCHELYEGINNIEKFIHDHS